VRYTGNLVLIKSWRDTLLFFMQISKFGAITLNKY